MPRFVDRTEELGALRRLFVEGKAALVRVYGRRRLGKTDLLRQLIEAHAGLYCFIPEQTLPGILKHLEDETGRSTGRPVQYKTARDFFLDLPHHDRRLVVLDEYQRLAMADPGVNSHLQDVWDSTLKRTDLVLVLCGSAVGMMRDLDAAGAPLRGRFSHDLHLQPMTYGAIREFYPDTAEEECVARFGVFGATPHYHQVTQHRTFNDAILSGFLEPGAPFREEPRLLIETELRTPQRYLDIFEAIGTGARTLGDIAGRYGQPTSAYTEFADRLRNQLGFLRSDDPILGKKRRGRIRFQDPFFDFYYRFVYPNLSRLELGETSGVLRDIQKDLGSYLGRVFEEVARQTMRALGGSMIRGTTLRFDELGAWWDDEDELEVVAAGKKHVWAGEAKYTNQKPGPTDIDTLLRRVEKLAKIAHRPVTPLFFSKAGLTPAGQRLLEEHGGLHFDLVGIAKAHGSS